jgi:hypothetical protein
MSAPKLEVLTVYSSRWDEFTRRLEGPEGCNFQEKVPGNSSTATWQCDSTLKRPLAQKILKAMGDVDIPKTLLYCEDNGGYCDCEILFNVGAAHKARKERKRGGRKS